MLTITTAHYLVLAAILFSLSVAGIFINRKNVILLLMCIELMLLAVNFNFIAFSRMLERHAGPGIRVLHSHRSGCGSGHRSRDPRRAVPQHTQYQRRRARQAEGLKGQAWKTSISAIVLAPLIAAAAAGLFGKKIGRAGAHWVTIIGVTISFVLSIVVLRRSTRRRGHLQRNRCISGPRSAACRSRSGS